jgi:hypothetical protein
MLRSHESPEGRRDDEGLGRRILSMRRPTRPLHWTADATGEGKNRYSNSAMLNRCEEHLKGRH